MGQLLRTLGFAASSELLRLPGIIPGLGPLLVLIGNVWMLAAAVVAMHQALDFESTRRVVDVCLIGWLVMILLQILLCMDSGSPAPRNG